MHEIAGRENSLILPYELLQNNQEGFLHKLGLFLGETFVPQEGDTVFNKSKIMENVWRKNQRTFYLKPRRVCNRYDNWAIPLRFGFRGTIQLNERLIRDILSCYAETNKRLDKEENLGLKEYGYY